MSFAKNILYNRDLIQRLISRGIAEKYKGSILGIGWTIIQPILMLAIYTIVFSSVFKGRWAGAEELGSMGYAMNLFCGLIVFTLFAESVSNAPRLITSQKSLVKKIVFPLETLSITAVAIAVIQMGISTLVMLIFQVITEGSLSLWSIALPIIWAPMIVSCIGASLAISALAVYIKDIEQVIAPIVSLMMFMSAVFYPLDALPQILRQVMSWNLLAVTIEKTRDIVMEGEAPDWYWLATTTVVTWLFAEVCYKFFKKVGKGFADVV